MSLYKKVIHFKNGPVFLAHTVYKTAQPALFDVQNAHRSTP